MARLFLTNIDLNTNELQNAVVQNLSSAPQSGNKEGRIYYDVTNKALYLYTDGQWKPLASGGAAASSIELTGDVTGTANVDPATGKLTVSTTVDSSFVTLTGSQTLTNKTIEDVVLKDRISFTNNSDVETMYIEHAYTGTNRIVSDDDLSLRSTNGDIILYPGSDDGGTGKAYIHWGNDSTNSHPEREIATVGYVTNALDDATLNISGTANQIDVNDQPGNTTISLPSTIVVSDLNIGNGDSSISFSNSTGWININSDNSYVVFDSNLIISGGNSIITNNGDLTLTPDSGNVVINDNLITDTIVSKGGGADTLNISADSVQITSTNVTVGGAGTNGKLQILDSNSANAFVINGSDKTAQFGGNVTIDGDLNVNGNLNAVNRTEINVEDNTIRLNTGFTGTPSVDAGIIVERGTANDTAIIWNESNDQWTLTNDGSHYYAIARKYVEVIGDASNTSFDVVHNLGTRDITVMVRENNAEYNVVETDILMKDGNTVTIGFTDAPALNSYKVIIVG